MFDTGAQKSMIGWYGWGIIKQNGTCIDARGVNMGGTSKAGRWLKLVDARGVVKNSMDGKRYLLILSQDLFNPNLDKTLLAEDQIECYSFKVYT